MYLTEQEFIELSVIHLKTNEEGLFDFLIYKFQQDFDYQPGLSKKNIVHPQKKTVKG